MSKRDDHLAALADQTSGGAHDAVVFSGNGLELLKNFLGGRGLFKSKKGEALEKGEYDDPSDMDLDELEDFIDDNDVDGAPEQRDGESDDRYTKRLRRFLKKWISGQGEKKTKKNANGGELEAVGDEDDPTQGSGNDIITNGGKHIPKDALAEAIAKNEGAFDERRFAKHIDDIPAEFVDATPALDELIKSVRYLGKGLNGTNDYLDEISRQNTILGKALGELLKSNAAMAGEIELIKKQPANQPASGVVFMNKNAGGTGAGVGGGRQLIKSDIEDSLTVLMNKGDVEPSTLSRLGRIQSTQDLQAFVESLPQTIQDQL